MPPRSLRWIRPSGGASCARAVGATAAVAEAAAVVFMNARRFISYGEVMTLPLQLDDPGIVTLCHSRLDGRIASTFRKAHRQDERDPRELAEPLAQQLKG